MPQEIDVRFIIPAIRREIAKILVHERKNSQKDAAKFLDITAAAVSQYINSKRATQVEFSDQVVKEIRKLVDTLNKNHTNFELMKEIYKISNLQEVIDIKCLIHKSLSKNLDECAICFEKDHPVQITT